jgi:hypothetical protein
MPVMQRAAACDARPGGADSGNNRPEAGLLDRKASITYNVTL